MAENPAAAATAAFEALKRFDVAGLVKVMHPDALDQFKRQMLAMATMQGTQFIIGDQVVPQMPSMLKPVFQVGSIEDLDSLSPETVFTRWLRMRFRNASPTPMREIIGSLPEGQDVHVVFRETSTVTESELPWSGIMPQSTIRILTTRRMGSEWAIMLNGGLFFNDDGTYSFGWVGDEDSES